MTPGELQTKLSELRKQLQINAIAQGLILEQIDQLLADPGAYAANELPPLSERDNPSLALSDQAKI